MARPSSSVGISAVVDCDCASEGFSVPEASVSSSVPDAVVAVPGRGNSSDGAVDCSWDVPFEDCVLKRKGEGGGFSAETGLKAATLFRDGEDTGELPQGESPAGSSTPWIVEL